MSAIRRILIAASLAMPLAAQGAGKPAYSIIAHYALGTPERWDFLYFEPVQNRVYVSHRSEVTVVDGRDGTIIGHVGGLDPSHGVVAVPSLGRGYADSGDARTVVVFDLKTFKTLATLPSGEDSDAMVYDPATKRIFVMDADGAAFTAIDAVTDKTIATMPLGGKPEMAVSDGAGKIYVNVASAGELVRVDAASLKIETRWPLPGCTSPHGLAMGRQTHRLFVSCENEVMQVVSSDDGKLVAALPIGKGTDSAAFDPKRKRAFSSNGDGTLSVIQEQDANTFVALPTVSTPRGARTMTLDPATGRVFLVSGDVAETVPSDKPGHEPHVKFVPGSLELFVLKPAD